MAISQIQLILLIIYKYDLCFIAFENNPLVKYSLARIKKHFRLRFKKILFFIKPRFKKYRPRLNIMEHQLLKP